MAHVTIAFVDGSKDDYEADSSLLQRLKELKSTGLDGKELADKLLTDDWAAPPKWVHISDGDFETQYNVEKMIGRCDSFTDFEHREITGR